MDRPIFRPIQSPNVHSQQIRTKPQTLKTNAFSDQLQTAIRSNEKLTISKHAKERIQKRGIHINDARWERIEEKVNEAKKMGVNDSLVLLQDAALIVSAKNNTVITAMDRNEVSSQIFTNINGTIILDE
ncbi:TIGR02530 family flagellar biosynthesis protein [Bacillus massilinigeriensis]|uniref:TIGR02530 family flagellar biosynthesis protein n=1 Tax=Bacillus massilionigeriensis TaxID=1805475 RepID=UPI00096B19D4|nr:TIGR02530 family flagellar biosynthesis protein [Bacillus massilionigeriensis]